MKKKRTEKHNSAQKPKFCTFCQQKTEAAWQDYEQLKSFLSPRSRILSKKMTGNCAKHQRRLTQAIKQARHLALLPFTQAE